MRPEGPQDSNVGIFNPVQRQLSVRKLLDEQQARQQENQLNQMKLQEAQKQQAEQSAIQRAYSDSGGDIDKFMRIAPVYGASPETMFKLQDGVAKAKKSLADMDESTFKAQVAKNAVVSSGLDAVMAVPEEGRPAAWQQTIQQLSKQGALSPEEAQQYAQYPGPDQLKQMDMQRKTTEQLHQQAADERAAAVEKRAVEVQNARRAAGTLGGALAAKPQDIQNYEYYAQQEKAAGRPPMTFEKWVDRQNAAKTSAAADKSDKTMGYAADKDGNVIYTSKGEAEKSGSVFEQITPTDVNKDRQAISLMSNTQLNTSNYKKALDALPGPISVQHSGWMQDILTDPKLDDATLLNYIGAGSIASVARQIGRAREWNMLTEPERNALTQYLRAKAAVLSYQRAITNQGRTNPEALHVEFSTIPEPFVGSTAAAPRFDAFQENIDQVASRFPSNLPGAEHPRDIRKRIEGSAKTSSTPPAGATMKVPGSDGKLHWSDGKIDLGVAE
jgi:hypothetical protein